MEWIQKYEPQTVNDLIGNKAIITKIYKWLQDYYTNENTNHSIILSGPHGSGKTVLSKLLLRETGYKMLFLDSNKLKNQEIFTDFKKKVQNKGSVHNLMTKTKVIKYALVIDNSENITLNSEKNSILNFHKENEKNKLHPIILITTSQHSKMISDIKKKHKNEYFLDLPTNDDLKIVLDRICSCESITIESEAINMIIDYSQRDIRRLINLLYDLKITFSNKHITIQDFESFTKASRLKDVDIGLFEATRLCMDQYSSMHDTIVMYEMEKVLLPLMIYENYKNKLYSQIDDKKECVEKSCIIGDYISNGDIIETNIYTDQNWYLQNIHGFYTCCVPAFFINETKTCKKKVNYTVTFSSDLNKTSSKNINKKNFNILKSSVIDKSSIDLLYINKIFYHLAKLENYTKIAQLMIEHNISIKHFEIFIKLDKTVNEKINFTAKTKRILQKEVLLQMEILKSNQLNGDIKINQMHPPPQAYNVTL